MSDGHEHDTGSLDRRPALRDEVSIALHLIICRLAIGIWERVGNVGAVTRREELRKQLQHLPSFIAALLDRLGLGPYLIFASPCASLLDERRRERDESTSDDTDQSCPDGKHDDDPKGTNSYRGPHTTLAEVFRRADLNV